METRSPWKEKPLRNEIDRLRKALSDIAGMGSGISRDAIDWGQIGKNAVYLANEAIQEKCKLCGKSR